MSEEANVPLMTHHTFSTIPVQQTGESVYVACLSYQLLANGVGSSNITCNVCNEI